MTDEIPPQWAWDEVGKRAPIGVCHTTQEWARYADHLRCLLASLIAQHEEPPVDPVEQAAAKIRRDYLNNHYTTSGEAFEAAVRRGIELGKAGAA